MSERSEGFIGIMSPARTLSSFCHGFVAGNIKSGGRVAAVGDWCKSTRSKDEVDISVEFLGVESEGSDKKKQNQLTMILLG